MTPLHRLISDKMAQTEECMRQATVLSMPDNGTQRQCMTETDASGGVTLISSNSAVEFLVTGVVLRHGPFSLRF